MKAGVWVAIKRMTAGVKAAAWKVEVARLAALRLPVCAVCACAARAEVNREFSRMAANANRRHERVAMIRTDERRKISSGTYLSWMLSRTIGLDQLQTVISPSV